MPYVTTRHDRSWLRPFLAFVTTGLLALAVLPAGSPVRADSDQEDADDAEPPGRWPAEWPIVEAPGAGPVPMPELAPALPPASRGARRILREIDGIQRSLRSTRYQHWLDVNRHRGRYHWDCSLMVNWVLRRAAPWSVHHLRSAQRPRAVHFATAIERAPTHRYVQGWRRIEHIQDVRPGDVFAWRRPPRFPSRNTGHTGFVLRQPQPVPGLPNGWAVEIADATRSYHQRDSRMGPGDGAGGFGTGVLAFLADDEGRGTHYGWFGTRSEGYVITPILFGRVGP